MANPIDETTAVDWYYRALIKDPKDSIADIAAGSGYAPKTISEAIDDVERLFSLMDTAYAETDDLIH